MLKRYENLQDSCIYKDIQEFFGDYQKQQLDYSRYGILNMLNCKYLIVGQQVNGFVKNEGAIGPAWFIRELINVNSPTEELAKVGEINTQVTAVMDVSKFKAAAPQYDSVSWITLIENKPNYLKYEAETQTGNLAVFSEIYYPEGWTATIDDKEVPILRANFVLRALEIPAGKHVVEFRFAPKSYTIGNPLTSASSWLLLLVVVGSMGWSLKEREE